MLDFLSLDASSTHVGWALSTNGLIVKCGVEKTSAGKENLSTRLARVFIAVKDILSRSPSHRQVIIEEAFFYRGQKTSTACYAAFGVTLASARLLGARLRLINPSSWHSIFFLGGKGGKGDELKRNVQTRMREIAPKLMQELSSWDAADSAAMLWSFLETVKSGNPLGEYV